MQRTARPTLKRPRHPLRPWLLPPTRTRVTRRRRAARPRPRPWITATCRCRAGRRLLTPAIRMATQWPDIGIGRLRRTRCAAADAGRRTQVLFVARRNSGTPLHAQRRRLHGLRPPGVVWDDHNKAVVKAEGDIAKGKLEESRTELLWGTPSHRTGTPSSAFGWITGRPEPSMVGFRHPGPRPYWFELEATGYVGSGGRTALRVEGSYELLLTQRLILEPRAELQFYGKDDPERGIGKGLAEASAGLRLRYEFSRQFAPISAWNGRAASDAPRTMCVPKAAVRSRRAGWLACDSGSRT